MKQSCTINNSKNKDLNKEKYFLKNIFDENFLNEKDKALSSIVLSDVIPEETIKTSLNEKEIKEKNFKIDKRKDIKYGSNIEYIGSKIDDNDDEFCTILNEQICKIISEQKLCKKPLNGKTMRKKI